MSDGSIEFHKMNPRPPGPLVEACALGDFMRRAGDVLIYQGRQGERAVRFLEYAPPGVVERGDDGSLNPIEGAATAFAAAREQFALQSGILAGLSHPNIVEVIDSFGFGGTEWRVEQLTGPSLAENIAQGKFLSRATATQASPPDPSADPEAVMRIIADIAPALAAAHSAGLTHLNVSPETVVQGSHGEMLSAFGVDRRPYLKLVADRRGLVRSGYTPLELDDPTAEEPIGPATDVYALSALAWRLITGETPPAWNARDNDTLRIPDDRARAFPSSFLGAISHGLAVEPEARPQTVEPFLHDGPVPPPEKIDEPGRRGFKISSATVFGAYILILVAAFILSGRISLGFQFGDNDSVGPEVPADAFDPENSRSANVAPDGCFWSLKPNGPDALFCGDRTDGGRPSQDAMAPEEVNSHGLRIGDMETAGRGEIEAMRRLATYYLAEGRGYDAPKGTALLRDAASKGDSRSGLALAAILTSGGAGIERDLRGARDLYNAIVSRPDDSLAPSARARLFEIEPEVWNGGWLTGSECTRLTLTETTLSFDPFSGTIRMPRDPGAVVLAVSDVAYRLELSDDGESLTMTPMNTGLDEIPEVYRRCQP